MSTDARRKPREQIATLAEEWQALGTGVRLVVTEEGGALPARRAVEAVLAAVDGACSRFRDDSELWALNNAGSRWVSVSRLLLEALDAALWAAMVTGGAVDPTIGGPLRAVGYDRDFAAVAADAAPIVVRLRPAPGWQAVALDHARCRVRLGPGVELDLGSTAKALAADRAAVAAQAAAGSGGILVSLGGDIAVAGEAPEGGWPVLVAEDHTAPLDPDGDIVLIADGGLATSSTRVRRWTRGEVELHHIIDPATGAPVQGPWRTATVAAATCLEANTAATAAIVMGVDGVGWLEERGLSARLVSEAGEVTTVGDWPREEGDPPHPDPPPPGGGS
jgi:thiamine biosynthesis lipoprotein ApbE